MSTTIRERTEPQKAYDAEVLERVKRGIALLEREHGPNWVDDIDLALFDIGSSECCIIGQLYEGHYGDGRETLGLKNISQERAHGFLWTLEDDDKDDGASDTNALQAAWLDILTPKVEKRP